MGIFNGSKNGYRLVWGIIMVVIYLCIAFIVVFTNLYKIKFEYRIGIGVLLCLYGLFRGIRLWKQGV